MVSEKKFIKNFVSECKKKKKFGMKPSEKTCKKLAKHAWKKYQEQNTPTKRKRLKLKW
jgi:hypothetical protein